MKGRRGDCEGGGGGLTARRNVATAAAAAEFTSRTVRKPSGFIFTFDVFEVTAPLSTSILLDEIQRPITTSLLTYMQTPPPLKPIDPQPRPSLPPFPSLNLPSSLPTPPSLPTHYP